MHYVEHIHGCICRHRCASMTDPPIHSVHCHTCRRVNYTAARNGRLCAPLASRHADWWYDEPTVVWHKNKWTQVCSQNSTIMSLSPRTRTIATCRRWLLQCKAANDRVKALCDVRGMRGALKARYGRKPTWCCTPCSWECTRMAGTQERIYSTQLEILRSWKVCRRKLDE